VPALDFADAIYICFSDSIIAVRHSKVLCDLNWFLAMEYSKEIVSQCANSMLHLIYGNLVAFMFGLIWCFQLNPHLLVEMHIDAFL